MEAIRDQNYSFPTTGCNIFGFYHNFIGIDRVTFKLGLILLCSFRLLVFYVPLSSILTNYEIVFNPFMLDCLVLTLLLILFYGVNLCRLIVRLVFLLSCPSYCQHPAYFVGSRIGFFFMLLSTSSIFCTMIFRSMAYWWFFSHNSN